MEDHPLAAALTAAAQGGFPPVDGVVEFVGPDEQGTWAVVSFTGHAFVLSDRRADDFDAFQPDGFGAALTPPFLAALTGARTEVGSLDVVLVRSGTGAGRDAPLPVRDDLEDHPRVRRARRHRRSVRVLGDERGLVCLGLGLVGRTELSVELFDGAPAGSGRSLVAAALGEFGTDEAIFAQVAAGNTASLRMFLAAGFRPIGSELLIEP